MIFNISPLIIPIVCVGGWVIVTWIRAHYGVPGPFSLRWGDKNAAVPPMFDKLMNKAMTERDAEIAALRERIEVLERLMVDGHKSRSLSDEIEKLRRQQ
ncbi:MAG: hypothetical protein LBF16_03820 [Pseudomonadales bacterium]|jgi:hypothetical protein|nr:hypothetical protein [Pseudomonadales bacterium]